MRKNKREKRSAIGEVNIDTSETFWTDGSKGALLKQNKRILFSKIDYLQELSTIAETEDEVIKAYNDMDFYYILIKLIDTFGYDNEILYLSFLQAYNCLLDGKFNINDIDLSVRNDYFTSLLSAIITDTKNNNLVEYPTEEFYINLFSELINNNLYINAITDEVSTEPPTTISGSEKDWGAELKECGSYFTYAKAKAKYFLGKENQKAQIKRANQQTILNRLIAINPQYSGGVGDNLVNSGIIAQCGGTADDMVETIKAERQSKVSGLILGMSIGAFISLCVSVVVAVLALWQTYLEYKQAKVDQQTAELLNKKTLDNNCPSNDDFGGDNPFGYLPDADGDGKVSKTELKSFYKKICLFGVGFVILYQIL